MSRCIFGALPNSTSMGRSIGGRLAVAAPCRDPRRRWRHSRRPAAPPPSPCPTTANGQRSRAQMRGEFGQPRRAARPARSVPAIRCTTAASATATDRRWAPCPGRSRRPGRSRAAARESHSTGRPRRRRGSSGSDCRRPAPTQRSMTSWQRRSISGLSRCTLAKSRSSALSPEATELAAPPPRPISIAGPPSTITASPGCRRCFRPGCDRSRRGRRRA